MYYNDDYLDFLITKVWKITEPINIVDYGCGFGFLGLKLLPMLPAGSTYTGVDKGTELLNKARELFRSAPYTTEFIQGDIEEIQLDSKYDAAMCHAFLLHMTDPRGTSQKMIDSVCDGGKVICFETHWISNMSNYYLDGMKQSEGIKLGVLQKLYEEDSLRNGKDGNIGIKIPVLLSQLGLRQVESRVSDKVNFLDQNMDETQKEQLYSSLREGGLGQVPGDLNEMLESLMNRGLSKEEAQVQYDAELAFSREFGSHSWLTYAPSMKITFGTVRR